MLPSSSVRSLFALLYILPMLTRLLIKLLPYMLVAFGLLMTTAWVIGEHPRDVFFSLMSWIFSVLGSF